MELSEFLLETQAEVRAQMDDGSPYAEIIFSEVVMQHMSEIGMTFEPVACHFKGREGNAILRISGYAISEEADQLDLFVSLYEGVEVPTTIPDANIKQAVEQCIRFLASCASGKMAERLDPASDIHSLVLTINEIYAGLDQIRIFVLTDQVARVKNFKPRLISGKSVKLEVMDIERLYRHSSEGKPHDELAVNFIDVCGTAIPCVVIPGEGSEYDYALTAIPGEALRFIYERFGARLLEANVRSFLSVKGKASINAGIQQTLRTSPSNFMAYNNGIVLIADEIRYAKTSDGVNGISWLKGMQIVNGGQTTASLYFAKKKFSDVDLSKVRVPAKIIIMHGQDQAKEEALVSDISKFANSQNVVKQSDLSAKHPFHVAVERLAGTVYCPDGIGRWFYERTAGSYNTLLSRETPAKMRALKESIPPSRKITKTELAKYMNAWDKKPDIVSKGFQKNYTDFMGTFPNNEVGEIPLPRVKEYKAMIAKAIIFRATQKLVRPMFGAWQANVATYAVSVLACKLGDQIDLGKVWDNQKISPELYSQIGNWSKEVNDVLHRTALKKNVEGKMVERMISEWAKLPECRDAVLSATYSEPEENIPEIS